MSLAAVARRTLDLLDAGEYVAPSGATVSIAEAQAAAVAGTRLYTPEQLAALRARAPEPSRAPPAIAVTDETTQVAARRLVVDEARADTVVLNYASARNHGGGFLGGARAQEEDLCRCSGLYPTLLVEAVQPYYTTNRAQRSLLYTDHLIHGPRVPWFRVRGRGELLEAPFEASVITAPAPNAGPMKGRDPEGLAAVPETFARRWRNVLAVAEDRGHRALVLGAWGCGAFQNDPRVAAQTLRDALADPRFGAAFDQVVLAIPRKGKQSTRNHEVFADVFGPHERTP